MLHIQTPTYHSAAISTRSGRNIYLKMEAYQPTGSFKIRGLGRLCELYAREGKELFVSSSGGNAGVAAAYAGAKLGIPVEVYLPDQTNQLYLNAIELYGARTLRGGEAWDDANLLALQAASRPNAAYIPPFDHPEIWLGHATMMAEVKQAGIKPDAVVLSVGGGGLCCGVLTGMHQVGWDDIPVITVETKGAASFARSVAANTHLTLDKIDTIAATLGAKRVCDELWEWRKRHRLIPVQVSDSEAVMAISQFADDQRTLIEPASAAAMVPIYQNYPELAGFNNILVIICGGVGVSQAALAKWQQQI